MSAHGATHGPVPESPAPASAIDWTAIEHSPQFQELVKRRRRFVVPATIFFLAWFFGFIILAGYAPDFMGEKLVEGFTVGYAIALSQFVMVWVLCWLYLRQADRVFDPLAERAVEQAVDGDGHVRDYVRGDGDGHGPGGSERGNGDRKVYRQEAV